MSKYIRIIKKLIICKTNMRRLGFTAGIYAVLFISLLIFQFSLPVLKGGVIVIKNGSSKSYVYNNLYKKGFVRHQFSTKIFGILLNLNINAGEFKILKTDSVYGLLRKIDLNKSITYSITIPEGYSTQQMIEVLINNKNLTGNTVVKNRLLWLPQTYSYTVGTKRQDIIKKMEKEFQSMARPLWNSRAKGLPFKTLYQAVIMASIVEKETGMNDERELVASVFINRLKKNMKLQSDPTVIYAISNGYGKIARKLRRVDWKYPSKYNTYYSYGLPPQPISGVSRASLYAVLNPANTKFYYFMANGNGGHNFADTLSEHNKNVRSYFKKRKK